MPAIRILCKFLLILAAAVLCPLPINGETIVLRDLSLIRDDPIQSFDDRGVILASGKQINWSKILRASVDQQDQLEFDRYVNEVGLPLFRLESRLLNGDWAGIGSIAEPLYAELRSDSIQKNNELSFLICRATMESRLYEGDRMGAVEPFLSAIVHQKHLGSATNTVVTKSRLPESAVTQMISEQVLPVWFDSTRAAFHFAKLHESIDEGRIPRTAGALIYLASLAVAAENYGLADQLIDEIRSQGSSENWIDDWATLVAANRKLSSGETGQGKRMLKRLASATPQGEASGSTRAIAVYLLGSQRHLDSVETQMLYLLRVPALYGIRYPSLSAASLYRAYNIAKEKSDAKQSRILLNELLRTYPNTYHGRLAVIEK